VLALAVIDGSQIVIHMDCIMRTFLFAEFAAHAADFAELAGNAAFVGVVTGNDKFGRVGDHGDHTLGAGVLAGFAALAGLAIYHGYAVDNVNGVEFTNLTQLPWPRQPFTQ